MKKILSFLLVSLICVVLTPLSFADSLQGVWKTKSIIYETVNYEIEEVDQGKQLFLILDIREDGQGTMLLNEILYPVSLRQIKKDQYALTDKDDSLILLKNKDDKLICRINKQLTILLEKSEEQYSAGITGITIEEILEQEDLLKKAETSKKEEEIIRPASIQDLHVSFSEEDTQRMSNYMLFGRYYFNDNEMIGMAYDKSGTLPNLVRSEISLEGNTPKQEVFTVIDRHVNANFLTGHNGVIYYIRVDRNKDSACIARLYLDDYHVQLLKPEMHEMAYLQVHENRIWFTGDGHRLYSCDLEGNDCRIEIDKTIYDPYFINNDWLIYQDEADGETFHLRHIGDGTDIRITDTRSYNPIVDGNYLYFTSIPDDGGKAYISRIDLNRPIKEGDDCFKIIKGNLPMSKSFAIINHFIYGENRSEIGTDAWRKMTNNAWLTVTDRYFYFGDQYIIYGEMYSEHGSVLSLYLENLYSSERILFRHVY